MPVPGAYGLLIRLPCSVETAIGALGRVRLAGGNYLYLGSAYGPGGLPARLRRHVRSEKRHHWHVDRVTSQGTVERIFVLPDGRECDLVRSALAVPKIRAPIIGFGSTDCRLCPAHLLAVPRDHTALIKAYANLI